MAELYSAFDAAISATGYNTSMELLHHGVSAAFVPFARQVDDQEARAHVIESNGAGIAIPTLTPESLSSAVDALLDPERAARFREAAHRMVPDSGAARAAEAITALLG
jgi:UDP-N-acetylglucosamine:LPS N-acetylglucosamine transferase